MRSFPVVAPLLFAALASSASAQGPTGYCRIYRSMTIGTSACYYCLKCPTCDEPVGYVGGWDELTGGCGVCDPNYCFGAAAAPVLAPGGEPAPAPPGVAPPPPAGAPRPPGAAPPAATPALRVGLIDVAPLTEEPDVLYDPKIITVDPVKWIVTIDVTEDMVENPVKVFLVTAYVKPKKKTIDDFHKGAFLGFGVQIGVDVAGYQHVKAVDVEADGVNRYKFKIQEFAPDGTPGTKHKNKCTAVLAPVAAVAPVAP